MIAGIYNTIHTYVILHFGKPQPFQRDCLALSIIQLKSQYKSGAKLITILITLQMQNLICSRSSPGTRKKRLVLWPV